MTSSPQDDGSELEIAIIGYACRYAGARSPRELWKNLSEGVDAISSFSDDALRAAGVRAADLARPGYVKARGVIGDAELFDAALFGVTPREAELMDPQHRHLLECGWEALEDAGHDPSAHAGRVGVFVGAGINTYLMENLYPRRDLRERSAGLDLMIAGDKDFVATRMSYKLDLRGPSVVVQSACSTSLVAVHLACQALLSGECDVAIAGGATVRAPETRGYIHEEGMIFSPDGRCRAFDAAARGSVPANGVGLVVLKRLGDAIADRDHIRAIIKGSAINNDGAARVGYAAPGLDGQTRVILAAHAAAQVEARSVSYVEAHGSGTPLGDAVEIAALRAAFRRSTDAERFCAIGSVKTGIGHADIAAGTAGLIKAVMALEHRLIPASLHFERPNPEAGLDRSPFYVNDRARPWGEGDHPRRAGVSSFGLGGTNAHVVLEEAPPLAPLAQPRHGVVLLLSAKTPSALEASTDRLARHLEEHPEIDARDVAFTLAAGRRPLPHRRAVLADDRASAVDALQRRDAARILDGAVDDSDRPVAFLFPGVGDHYVGMARDLYRDAPAFRDAMDRCLGTLKSRLDLDLRDTIYPPGAASGGAGWDLRAMVGRREGAEDATSGPLQRASVLHPLLFSVEYALAQMWMERGVRPTSMLGYSLGEHVAACLAGVWSLDDALWLIARRGQLVDALPAGAMLAVAAPEHDIASLLEEGVWVSGINGPLSCGLAGEPAAIDAVQRRLEASGIMCRLVRNPHAFHSPRMAPIARAFEDLVARIAPKPPRIPFFSNVTGRPITAEQASSPAYWVEQMCSPVRFAEALEALSSIGAPLLLELGPGRALGALALQHPTFGGSAIAVASLRHAHQRGDDSAFAEEAAARLWLGGAKIDWARVYAHTPCRKVALPTYPFERERFWIDPPARGDEDAESDSDPSAKADVSRWLYAPSWQRSLPPKIEAIPGEKRWCIFLDACGVGAELAGLLEAEGHEVLTVDVGERFERVGERAYRVSPTDEGDHDALLRAIGAGGQAPGSILHLWSVSARGPSLSDPDLFDERQRRGARSILTLAGAIARGAAPASVRLFVISNGLHEVAAGDATEAAKATLLAACTVIRQEIADLVCRHIDIAPPGDHTPLPARQILAEIQSSAEDLTVAYRHAAGRFMPAFESVQRAAEPAAVPLRRNGVYVILGGLGAVGSAVAGHLARATQARLVLIGRTRLPPRDRWGAWLEERGDRDPISRKLKVLLELERDGADFVVASADVTDEAAMRAALDLARSRFGSIHGVIHAAGETWTVAPVAEAAGDLYARLLSAKGHGVHVLERLLRGQALDFVALFSSTASVLGGPGLAAYAAACAFMDAFARRMDQACGMRWISIDWDGWLSGDATAAEANRTAIGEFFMSRAEALEAFDRVLASPIAGHCIVSKTDFAARVARWTGKNARSPATALGAAGNDRARPAYVPPEGEAERAIAGVWEEILRVEKVGRHESFFALGGDSLLGTRLVARLKATFDVEITMRHLWRNPSVFEMALAVEELIIDQLLAESPDGAPPSSRTSDV